jgi:hypothetical protein
VIYDVKLESERDATDAKKLAGGVEGIAFLPNCKSATSL